MGTNLVSVAVVQRKGSCVRPIDPNAHFASALGHNGIDHDFPVPDNVGMLSPRIYERERIEAHLVGTDGIR